MSNKTIKQVSQVTIKNKQVTTKKIHLEQSDKQAYKYIDKYPGLSATQQYVSDLDEGELMRFR